MLKWFLISVLILIFLSIKNETAKNIWDTDFLKYTDQHIRYLHFRAFVFFSAHTIYTAWNRKDKNYVKTAVCNL